jgi:hypothetical protein
MLYYVAVAFIVVYFASAFGYTTQRANDLANYFWITDAVALIGFGLLSDKLLVRKPLMLIGAAISLVGTALFAITATDVHTAYGTFALFFVVIALRARVAPTSVGWRRSPRRSRRSTRPPPRPAWPSGAGYCESSSRSPSRHLPAIVPAVNTLVGPGQKVQAIAAAYPRQVAVLKAVDATTLNRLKANSKDQAAQVSALSSAHRLPHRLGGGGRRARRRGPARRSPADRAVKDAAGRRQLPRRSRHQGQRHRRRLSRKQVKLIQTVGAPTHECARRQSETVSARKPPPSHG